MSSDRLPVQVNEQRAHPRAEAEGSVRVKAVPTKGVPESPRSLIRGSLVNVSAGGARIVLEIGEPLSIHSLVELKVRARGAWRAFRLTGRVCSTRKTSEMVTTADYYTVGVDVTETPPRNMRRWMRYVHGLTERSASR